MAPIPDAQHASQQAARAADRAQVTANNTANKLSKWVDENRTLVLALATGTLALGGYYLYSRSSSSSAKAHTPRTQRSKTTRSALSKAIRSSGGA